MSGVSGELRAAALAWIDGDPEPATRAELQALLAAGDVPALAERLKPLAFGTAGLRGAVGAGAGRMNVAVVIRTAAGLASYLLGQPEGLAHPVVIGFDARPTSRSFAEASAGVLLAAGFRVVAFATPTATPLCAFLGRELGAAATIVVTASHNPRGDNGYKVYAGNAVQIVTPVDEQLAEHIARAAPARLVPRLQVTFDDTGAEARPAALTLLHAQALDSYFNAVSAAILPASAERTLSIVYSALHGVGTLPMLRTLADAGFTNVSVVAAQAEPDGTFPTTPFPNPEEPGTLDLALAEGERRSAALLLVNDPDADRLAAAARLDGVLTVLDGNQVGALLASAAMSRADSAPTPLVLTSVVSSPLVGELARARGAHFERTHTGFKWLWNAALELEAAGKGRFCFAYEEALGYSVFSQVRDKDGIAAGRALAELAATCAARGESLFDRLYAIYAEHGLWASAARNVALQGADAAARVAERLTSLVAEPELTLAGVRCIQVIDYRVGGEARPRWLAEAPLVELVLANGSRVFARPSGTEPKLKLYGHVRRAVTQRSDFAALLGEARMFAATLLHALETSLRL